VHFSTDYVFDGAKGVAYTEADAPNPISAYGVSKLGGERLAHERCEGALVIRVSGLFGIAKSGGKGGTNFVETMLWLAREGRPPPRGGRPGARAVLHARRGARGLARDPVGAHGALAT